MPNTLVVMRLKGMSQRHPGQDNSKACGICGHRVGIYPSGQLVLARAPDTEIVCDVCSAKLPPADFTIPAPGAIEEALRNRRKPH